ncbi:SapB/AmfS family lanthipeptide [Streptomyces sp. TRM 70351]|nr:SapB/AmfS family lanthipeptide [Streptomyces sp. TRM 70351]MEE1928558.1 SapB/AmfS family lanthipeptide [Streptomyces sp. TRM 70351]
MALLDLQKMETPKTGGDEGSNVSLLACDKQSTNSVILCL